ncbi:hypothetical protein PMEGAS228_04530 [Priestia megaterium]
MFPYKKDIINISIIKNIQNNNPRDSQRTATPFHVILALIIVKKSNHSIPILVRVYTRTRGVSRVLFMF